MKLVNTAMVAASAGGSSPTVFTLTLDDLSTRFDEYNGAAASIKFKLTATNGGGALTTSSFVYLDSSQGSGMAASALDAIGDVATLIQTQLNAIAGYSGITVDGVETQVGDQWDFTITFPGVLGVTGLDFHASSQWYPTVTLVEAVTQQGRDYVAGAKETFTLTCTAAEDQISGEIVSITIPNVGAFNITFNADSTTISTIDPDGDYILIAGGLGQNYATMERSVTGAVDSPYLGSQSSNGTYSFNLDVEGSDEVTNLNEIHTITPYPVYPTGGTWAPNDPINTAAWNGNEAAVESALDIGLGADVVNVTQGSGTTGISDGYVIATWVANGVIADNFLTPINIDLTAPEITHSIT